MNLSNTHNSIQSTAYVKKRIIRAFDEKINKHAQKLFKSHFEHRTKNDTVRVLSCSHIARYHPVTFIYSLSYLIACLKRIM